MNFEQSWTLPRSLSTTRRKTMKDSNNRWSAVFLQKRNNLFDDNFTQSIVSPLWRFLTTTITITRLPKFSSITAYNVQSTTLAAYDISADTISHHCDGLPLFLSLCPLLPLWPVLTSVGLGSASGAAFFCCEGWAFGPSGSFSYVCC